MHSRVSSLDSVQSFRFVSHLSTSRARAQTAAMAKFACEVGGTRNNNRTGQVIMLLCLSCALLSTAVVFPLLKRAIICRPTYALSTNKQRKPFKELRRAHSSTGARKKGRDVTRPGQSYVRLREMTEKMTFISKF